jgi:hypothetical protein
LKTVAAACKLAELNKGLPTFYKAIFNLKEPKKVGNPCDNLNAIIEVGLLFENLLPEIF